MSSFWAVAKRAFLGQVSTRCFVPSSAGPSTTHMARTGHWARAAVRGLRTVQPNFYVTVDGNLGENAISLGTLTCRSALEYPAGVYTPFTYGGGSATGSVGTMDVLWTDPHPLWIPNNTQFWIRTQFASTGSLPWNYAGSVDHRSTPSGDALEETNTDKTTSGTITDNTFGTMMPIGLYGMTTSPSAANWGDSRDAGQEDLDFDIYGNQGEFSQAIGLYMPYVDYGVAGETASAFTAAKAAIRISLSRYQTVINGAHGINDLRGDTATNVLAYIQTISGLCRPRRYVHGTLAPVTTGTFNGPGRTGQTISTDISNPYRIDVNTGLRAGLKPVDGEFDTTSFMEDALNSGYWNTPGWTPDGLHEATLGNKSIIWLPGQACPTAYGFMPKLRY